MVNYAARRTQIRRCLKWQFEKRWQEKTPPLRPSWTNTTRKLAQLCLKSNKPTISKCKEMECLNIPLKPTSVTSFTSKATEKKRSQRLKKRSRINAVFRRWTAPFIMAATHVQISRNWMRFNLQCLTILLCRGIFSSMNKVKLNEAHKN